MAKASSYLRFNPDTKEIEIEGSQEFIKTYFDKIQQMLAQTSGEVKKEPAPEAVITLSAENKIVEKKAKVEIPATKKVVKVARKKAVAKGSQELSQFDKVVGLIQKSPKGITTSEITDKTGLTARQIWGITYRAAKAGKIKIAKKGVYLPWL